MTNDLNQENFVPDGNPLPGSDPQPDTAPTIGDPVPSDPTEPNGTPQDGPF